MYYTKLVSIRINSLVLMQMSSVGYIGFIGLEM